MLAVAAVCLASCAMPPKEAWRMIRTDGLIPYLAVEMGNKPSSGQRQDKPANRYIAPSRQAVAVAQVPAPAAKAALIIASEKKSPARPINPTPQLYLNHKPVATTPQVATSKPRSMDSVPVRPKAQAPENKATSKPNVVKAPSDAKPKVEQPKPKLAPTPVPSKPEVAKTPAAKKETPPATASKPTAPKLQATPKSNPATKIADKAPKSEDLPYGTPVTGRPGLVNSPYAGKMQLVDVTGLKAGQEVKCPYTGKLFRVPPGAQASNKSTGDKK